LREYKQNVYMLLVENKFGKIGKYVFYADNDKSARAIAEKFNRNDLGLKVNGKQVFKIHNCTLVKDQGMHCASTLEEIRILWDIHEVNCFKCPALALNIKNRRCSLNKIFCSGKGEALPSQVNGKNPEFFIVNLCHA